MSVNTPTPQRNHAPAQHAQVKTPEKVEMTPQITVPQTGSRKVVYASALGAKLDSDVIKGGGTDDTAILQAALDSAVELGSLHLIIDGAALVSGLNIHSNTTIECLTPACGFYLADNSNRPIIRNAHPSADERLDQNIQLVGGTYNGNHHHQVHHTEDQTWVVALAFFGVENLTVRDITIRDQRTFAMHLGQWRRVNLENIHIALPDHLEASNQDGIHVNGPGQFLTARNISGKSWDDFFALNADDGDRPLSETRALGPYVKEGAITDVLVDGLILDGASQGVRLLSRVSRIDRVTIRNITGHNRSYGVIIDTYHHDHTGNFGSLTFENIDLYQHDGIHFDSQPYLFTLGAKIENLTLRNIRRNNSYDSRPTVLIQDIAHIRLLTIDGLHIYENTKTSADTDYILVQGNIDQLVLRGVDVYRETELPVSGTLIHVAGIAPERGIRNLLLSDVAVRNLKHVAKFSSGRLQNIRAVNVFDDKESGATFDISGSVSSLFLSQYTGPLATQLSGQGSIAFTTEK